MVAHFIYRVNQIIRVIIHHSLLYSVMKYVNNWAKENQGLVVLDFKYSYFLILLSRSIQSF